MSGIMSIPKSAKQAPSTGLLMFSWQIWDANLTENFKIGDEFVFKYRRYIGNSDNLCCSNSSPILKLSVKFASQIYYENINKPLDGAYLADFGIDIKWPYMSKGAERKRPLWIFQTFQERSKSSCLPKKVSLCMGKVMKGKKKNRNVYFSRTHCIARQ